MLSTQPLQGITVIEIGHTVAAPYAGMILAELGANVIKVENPDTGDYTRGMPPFRGETSAVYQSLNRGKRSVSLDLKDQKDAELLRRLILDQADVVLHNLKFGAMEKLGFGANELLSAKPELVYCNVGAFGRVGPKRDRPGYDPLMQAYTGIMSIMGEEGRPPVRVGVSITDMAAGMWAVIGIQAACRERTRTGFGGVVDTSLFETALGWLTVQYASFDASGEVPKREGSGLAMMAPYQAFATADSFIMIAAGNDNNFKKLCRAINRVDLVTDARFSSNKGRVANKAALLDILEPILKSGTSDSWLALLEASGVPCSPIKTIDEVVSDPHALALDMFQDSPDGMGKILGLPVAFDHSRPPFRRPAPKLGEHTAEVFAPYQEN
ncbi:CaiB/BaiF CoA transferase family protein [Parapusillimonas sp. JC17]|uniref:CaiB/BaiF CoA transferase family protein n=1 Tax=Parapusillimonas sp. JC17 TaxID=3445768 RepID=UPI003FA0C8A7